MKKTLSLILAGLLTVAMGTAAMANIEEDNRGGIKFGVKGIAENVTWTADGVWTEGEYAEIPVQNGWISTAVNDESNDDAAKNLEWKLGMSWDSKYIYTYIEYEDENGHWNEWEGSEGSMWYSGAVQVNFAEVDGEAEDRLEYGVGRTSDTNNLVSTVWADYLGSGYEVPTSDYNVVVDGDTVIYEIRTPIDAFSGVAAKVGAQYSVCYVISWGNEQDYIHTQLAAGCTGWGKHADYFADITLEEAIVVETEPETVAEEVVDNAGTTPAAPATFDAGIIAAVAAIVSAAGYAVSKKR